MSGLLLAIDGDSLAHRAYHALPKSIRGPPGNALVGFAGFLSGSGKPSSRRRSSSAGTRSTRPPTGTRRSPPTSRAVSSRTRSSSSSTCSRPSSSRSASRSRRRPATRPTISWPPLRGLAGAGPRGDVRPRRVPARLRPRHDPAAGEGRVGSSRESAQPRCVSATASSPSRFRTSSRSVATRRTRSPARPASARRRPPTC